MKYSGALFCPDIEVSHIRGLLADASRSSRSTPALPSRWPQKNLAPWAASPRPVKHRPPWHRRKPWKHAVGWNLLGPEKCSTNYRQMVSGRFFSRVWTLGRKAKEWPPKDPETVNKCFASHTGCSRSTVRPLLDPSCPVSWRSFEFNPWVNNQ